MSNFNENYADIRSTVTDKAIHRAREQVSTTAKAAATTFATGLGFVLTALEAMQSELTQAKTRIDKLSTLVNIQNETIALLTERLDKEAIRVQDHNDDIATVREDLDILNDRMNAKALEEK